MAYGCPMARTTPPKGRPTTGRRDRQVAKRTSMSRSTTKKFAWFVLAVAVLIAVLVLGSGTGGNGVGSPTASATLPVLLLSRRPARAPQRPRS